MSDDAQAPTRADRLRRLAQTARDTAMGQLPRWPAEDDAGTTKSGRPLQQRAELPIQLA